MRSKFAPVISASIHRKGNYSDIRILMMVTETETLTSILHHNKFTYLDYIFLLPSYCQILIHIYFLIYIYIYIYNHHRHVVPLARISLILSRHFSLSFISSGRSSGLNSVSSHSCCMYVCAGRPAFARPYVGVHWSTSLMSTSLLLHQCPARLVRQTWIVFVVGGRWPYSWCLVGCCRQDLFNIARNILV